MVEKALDMVETPRAREKPASGIPASGIPAGGVGTGGPASGAPARAPFGEAPQPAPWTKSEGRRVANEIRATIADRRQALLDAQMTRALDPAHPQGHAAAVNLLDRIIPPESKATLAGDPDEPVAITHAPRARFVPAWARMQSIGWRVEAAIPVTIPNQASAATASAGWVPIA